jgi:hypothetical protein
MIFVYQAIKRPKENENMEGIISVREVHYPGFRRDEVITKLKARISQYPGVWRIYRSVNVRNEVKAKLEFIDTLTRQLVLPQSVSNKNPESLWKDILMQPRNKAERWFLIDVDTKDVSILAAIKSNPQIGICEVVPTPNGFHVVCEPFDPRLIESLPDVSVKKDALLYIETCTVT